MSTLWQRIARDQAGDDYAATYAEHFRRLAEQGKDTHGEAAFVAGLLTPPARVLDAGCGTGRVAVRLAELGYDVTGVDADEEMVAVARREAPDLDWAVGDLAALALGNAYDVVLLAGNVLPLLEPGTLPAVAQSIAAHTAPGGRVVSGFGLDEAHLPAGCPVLPLEDVDRAFEAAGLRQEVRWSTWDREPFDPAAGYVVTVNTRADEGRS